MRPIDADALSLKQKSHADLFKGSEIHDDIIRRDEATMALAEILSAPTIEAEPARKLEMFEADRKKCEEWCKDCEHIEMCAWYPFRGCDFRLLPKPEQEVRRGRWEEDTSRGSYSIYCSYCGSHKETICPSNYCPSCGAYMREEGV